MESLYQSLNAQYKLLIKCATFNHVKFIESALDGFASQKTTFEYLCYVVDDASSDGEQEVILNWIENNCDMTKAKCVDIDEARIIIAKPDNNDNCNFVVNLLNVNMYGNPEKFKFVEPLQKRVEYVALCEGDDYWTNPNKLQMQYDYLESHDDCSLCFHNAMIHYEDMGKEDALFSRIENRDYSGPEIYRTWTVPTASVFLRRHILDSEYYLQLAANKNFAYGDIILFISCAEQGVIHGFSEVMSVYRRQSTSYSYVAPMLPRCRHHYEIYKTIGGEYKDIARKNVIALAIPQFFLNIKDAEARAELFKMCWDVDKTQTILKIVSFPFRFINDKIHQ